MKLDRNRAAGAVLALALILAACQSGLTWNAPAPETSLNAALPEPTTRPQGEAPSTAAAVTAKDLAPTVEPGADVGQPTAATIRTELHATDPATVNLASGKPTLVEFFAFW